MKTLFDADARYVRHAGSTYVLRGSLLIDQDGRTVHRHYSGKLVDDLCKNWGAVEITADEARKRGVREDLI
jgi:hypothetical protein